MIALEERKHLENIRGITISDELWDEFLDWKKHNMLHLKDEFVDTFYYFIDRHS
tara:strand:- start:313 stop:474 length:162 start_codon:yes stop_codon:yes gene_type:complete